MQLIIDLPARDETLAHIRAGWERAIADPQWSSFEGRFETNAFGEIIMSPPPPFEHNDRGFRIAHEIQNQLGGHAMTQCPILTIDGVKVADGCILKAEQSNAGRDNLMERCAFTSAVTSQTRQRSQTSALISPKLID